MGCQMRRLVVVLFSVAALASAPLAGAAIVTRHDDAGRVVTFDVRARGVRVGWYAGVLRRAVHGDEIETARIRIVPRSQIGRLCEGEWAQSCYDGDERGGTLVIPAGPPAQVAHLLLHEYAHHIDMARSNFLYTDKPWASSWWAARGVKSLLARHRASLTYSLGWDRAVGEIFAEDYVQLNLRSRYNIRWLDPPSAAIKAALRRDLRATRPAPAG
jgi:hypothetical protein